jgi:hypothetical protein
MPKRCIIPIMFAKAIEEVLQFTRAIHMIGRYWDSGDEIEPGAATLFFVNDQGWVLTCGHVARLFRSNINERFRQFKVARDSLRTGKKSRSALAEVGKKFGYKKGGMIEFHLTLSNCVEEGGVEIEVRLHPSVDVALLKFEKYKKLLCNKFPVFAKDGSALKQGKSLCRVGFPFPEFTNFEYDEAAEEIRWTNKGRKDTPSFPIEGMVTRHLVSEGVAWGFELSTPGLKGQSGGPAFDTDGRIWGMQAGTNHLDLHFDVNKDVLRSGRKLHVMEHAFLHVGHCVHVDVLKGFMRKHAVDFVEG